MPFKSFAILTIGLLIAFLQVSCGNFNKLQKTGTPQEKLSKAIEYYNGGDYYKAGVLLEDVAPILKGKDEAEDALYYLANNYFKQKQFMMSAFYFKDFYLTYPRSKRVEETMYMHVYSLYQNSPEFNLDQTSTFECLKALTVFLTRYPNTVYLEECNKMADELNNKLTHKAFQHSMMYHKVGNYKSAVVAIGNFIKEHPNSKYAEEAYYTRFTAQYHLAKNSVQGKTQINRFHHAIEHYQIFADKFPESKFKGSAEVDYDDIVKQLNEIKSVKSK
jgi:outer membrane protein assembly factor BamD